MRRFASLWITFAVAILQGVPAAGLPIYVDATNTAGPWDGSEAYPYEFIQDGIDAADDGDTVIVFPGEYVETISFDGKAIVVTSENPDDPQIVELTVIQAADVWSAVTFWGYEGPDAGLRGFTITGGWGVYGGGICGNGTEAQIAKCVVILNQADYGGGIYGCDGEIRDCQITHNTVTGNGGGLWRCDGTILDCTIDGNSAAGWGGGVDDCRGTITKGALKNNLNNFVLQSECKCR